MAKSPSPPGSDPVPNVSFRSSSLRAKIKKVCTKLISEKIIYIYSQFSGSTKSAAAWTEVLSERNNI